MKNFSLLILLLGFTLTFTQCIDKEFDSPPLDGPTVDVPDEAVITIDAMMDLYSPGSPVALDAGSYLRGVVVGSDKSGNIFKTLMVQDETAGIAVIIDDTDLFDTYYVGREVYIKLDNLYLGDFNNLPQLGMAPNAGAVSRIPAALLSDVVLPAAYNVAVAPTPLLLGQLNDSALNTLIQLDNVEFASNELGETYATANAAQNIFLSENRSVVNCDGFSVNLRSSGFSDFANTEVAGGNGTLYGILSKFGTGSDAYQILIRDLGDVNFNGNRCDGSGGGSGTDIDPDDITDADVITISSVKDMLVNGTATSLPEDKFLKATIVANNGNGNFYRKVIVQDPTGGIEIRIDDDAATSTFPIGSEVYVILANLYIGEFAGLPQLGTDDGDQVNIITNASSVLLSTGNSGNISPKLINLSSLNDADLSSLVRIDGVQFSDADIPSNYASENNGFHNLQDCDGNELLVFTSSFSDYTSEPVPEGNGSFVGIFSAFGGDYQLNLRNPSEVSMTGMRCDGSSGGGGDPEGSVDEDFQSGNNNDPVSLSGWDNVATQGDRTWQFKEFDGNVYAQATAFNDEADVMETYLVTPELDFDMVTNMSFRSALQVYTHGGLEVLYSANYSGDPDNATWETINATLTGSSNADHEWVNSGDIDISGFSGAGHIAFKYTGSGPSGDTNSMRIDDVVIK